MSLGAVRLTPEQREELARAIGRLIVLLARALHLPWWAALLILIGAAGALLALAVAHDSIMRRVRIRREADDLRARARPPRLPEPRMRTRTPQHRRAKGDRGLMAQKSPRGVVRTPLVRVRQETPPPPSVEQMLANFPEVLTRPALGGDMQGSISTGLVGTPKVVDHRSTEGACTHAAAAEVLRALDDEVVAWWCPDCETQLPVDRDAWPKPSFVERYTDMDLLTDRLMDRGWRHSHDDREPQLWPIPLHDRSWAWQHVVMAVSLMSSVLAIWIGLLTR